MTDQIKKLNPKFVGRDEEICETINALIDANRALEKRVEGLEEDRRIEQERIEKNVREMSLNRRTP